MDAPSTEPMDAMTPFVDRIYLDDFSTEPLNRIIENLETRSLPSR